MIIFTVSSLRIVTTKKLFIMTQIINFVAWSMAVIGVASLSIVLSFIPIVGPIGMGLMLSYFARIQLIKLIKYDPLLQSICMLFGLGVLLFVQISVLNEPLIALIAHTVCFIVAFRIDDL